MKTARLIKDLNDWNGAASVYELSTPATWLDDSNKEHKTKYVIVSAVNSAYAYETFIFPSDEDGEPLSMMEMDGSMTDTVSHEDALSNAGYQII